MTKELSTPAETGMPIQEAAQLVLLTREQMLAAVDIVTELVEVPEWGGRVQVRGLTGRERDSFENSMLSEKSGVTTTNLINFRAKLVALSVVDAQGARVFEPTDVEALGRKSAAALQRVFSVAQRLSGLKPEDVKDLTEELEGNVLSAGSGTD